MHNFDQIQTFITIVEEKSFAAAAHKLGLSTAAVSRQIARLEEALGTKLLQRTTRKISLTDSGEQYFLHCKNALNELTAAQAIIANKKNEPEGVLRVMSNRYLAFTHILPRLADFMKQYPKLQVDLELAERLPDFEKEKIDLALGLSLEGPADSIRKRVATTQQIVCASPGYLKKHGTPKTPADLETHHILAHSGSRELATKISFKNKKEIDVKPIFYVNDAQALLACALKNMGIIKLRDYMVQDALEKKQLVEVLESYREPAQSIYLYYPSSRYLPIKIRFFIDFYFGE